MDEYHACSSVIIPNVHEYAQKGMDSDYPALLLARWRNIASGFSEAALFWEGDDKLVVSPKPIANTFVEYVIDLLGYKGITVITPQRYTTELCSDILCDEFVLSEIDDYVNARGVVCLRPWGATKQMYLLLDEIKRRNANLVSDELPDHNAYWSSAYIDSKIGFRELCVKLQRLNPNIQIPRGFTCDSFSNALEILRWFHSKKLPCVLKASSGAGGFGNVFLQQELFEQPFEEVEKYVAEAIKGLPYFKSGAAIVEELVLTETSESVAPQGCSSSVFMSGLILPGGEMKIVGGGTDMRDNQCYYAGAQIGKNNPLDAVIDVTEPVMYQIGEAISDYGYRGHWGVNFMISKDGTPIAIELNARRCGESHAYALAERLYGEKWMSECYAITRLPYHVQIEPSASLSSLLHAFEKTNAVCKKKGMLAIPTQVSWLHQTNPGMGYVILGTDKEAVRAVEHGLHEQLMVGGIKSRDSYAHAV